MTKEKVKKIVEKSVKELLKEKKVFFDFKIEINYSKDKIYGDYSTNVAMSLSKALKENPIEIAKKLKAKIFKKNKEIFKKIEIAEPGFINFFISEDYFKKEVKEILKKKEKFGSLKIGKNKKVNIDFISANPTGPLTLGNARGGFGGDVLSRVLKKAGYRPTKEYYINDVGEQIKNLGYSVIGDIKGEYKGDYIKELRKRIKTKDPYEAGSKAAKIILNEMIKPQIKKMGIKFDVWFSEKTLYEKGLVDKVIEKLDKKGLIYKKEEAVWFKSTQFGDDKDRVLIKSNGEKTYFASDISYMENKFKRGFKKLIFFFGADHYGYVPRLKAAAEALGYKKEDIDVIIFQHVRLFKDGKEVRMSKRKGIYVTVEELINEVGSDVARFFFVLRSFDSHLNFDLSLAKKQTEDNPLFYVQYAYVRIISILKKASKTKIKKFNVKFLNNELEIELIKQLIKFPEIVEEIALTYEVHKLTKYLIDLSDAFHRFYENNKVIGEDKNLTQSRLSLLLATKIVFENSFDLLGIKSLKKM